MNAPDDDTKYLIISRDDPAVSKVYFDTEKGAEVKTDIKRIIIKFSVEVINKLLQNTYTYLGEFSLKTFTLFIYLLLIKLFDKKFKKITRTTQRALEFTFLFGGP